MMIRKALLGFLMLGSAAASANPSVGLSINGAIGTNEYTDIGLGYGGWDDKKAFNQFFVSYKKAEISSKRDGVSLEDYEYQSIKTGFSTDSFAPSRPVAGSLYLYQNKIVSSDNEKELDRLGLGFSLGTGVAKGERFKAGLELHLLPQFLSTDWDDSYILETGLNAKAQYRLTRSAIAYIQFDQVGAVHDVEGLISNFYSASIGFSYLFIPSY